MTMNIATSTAPRSASSHPHDDHDTLIHDDPSTPPPTKKPETNGSILRLILKITATTDKVPMAILHRRCFELMTHADDNMELILSPSNSVMATNIQDFPTDDSYLATFKIIQRRSNQLSIAFNVRTRLTVSLIKRQSPNLVEHLKSHHMSLQASLTGSDKETSIGAILGVHPEKTSRDNLRSDLMTLLGLLDHHKIDPDIAQATQLRRPFQNIIPPFNLETRKINKSHDNLTFNTKAFHVICDSAHAQLITHIFEIATQTNLLLGIGKFISFKNNETTLCKAIKWHNDTISISKAFQITDFPNELFDQTINPSTATTWRQKLVTDGQLINAYRAKEPNRFIATSTDIHRSMEYFKTTFSPLFQSVHKHLPNPPVASLVAKPTTSKNTAYSSQNSIQTWNFLPDDSSMLTESTNFPSSRPNQPTQIQFIYSNEFPPIQSNSPSTKTLPKDTASKSSDTLTTITQDDLFSLRDQLRQEFKQELQDFKQTNEQHHLQHNSMQDHHNERMTALIKANLDNNLRIQQLVQAFQAFQLTIFNTLGITTDHSPADDTDEPPLPPLRPTEATTAQTTNSGNDGRKRDNISTPVHKTSSSIDQSDVSSPFLTPLSKTTSQKRHKGFNANHLYYQSAPVPTSLSKTFDANQDADMTPGDHPMLDDHDFP